MDNLAKTMIHRLSKMTHTQLSPEHMKILEYAYQYYEEYKVGPLYQNIKKHTGATREDIERLFPYGMNSIYTWIGIPIHSANKLCKPLANIKIEKKRDVYLDYNATTPLRKEIIEELKEFYQGPMNYGNPSSSTSLGKSAYDMVHQSRREISDCLGVYPENIIFVSCGTEANNLALKGIAFKYINSRGHIISSKSEHPSVLRTLDFLKSIGFEVTLLDLDKDGRITAKSVKDHIRNDTILVSITAVNNEIGVINPIEEIGKICTMKNIPFMVDAIQAFGRIPLKPEEMGISLLSISSHKIYGPKGVGGLYVEKNLSLVPMIYGGEQEFNIRAGTENVGAIKAFGHAAKLIQVEQESERKRLTGLRNFFLEKIKKIEPRAILNGSLENRLPNNINLGFPGIDSGSLLLSLNKIGIYASSGSACSAGSKEDSHVIRALGVDTKEYGILRFSFGLYTFKEDFDYLFTYLPEILKKLKKGGVGPLA